MAVMTVRAPAIPDGGILPDTFAAEGANVSPALRWRSVPRGYLYLLAVMLSEVIDEPPISRGSHVHWLIYNMLEFTRLDQDTVPYNAILGLNSDGDAAYAGPDASQQRQVEIRLYATREPVAGTDPLNWAEAQTAMAGMETRGPATITCFYPTARKEAPHPG